MSDQKGFTLVEISIVLIVVGILVGGTIKGLEMIGNARFAAAVNEVKSMDVAMLTFFDAYGYLPGDLPNPSRKLPNCPTTSFCGLPDTLGDPYAGMPRARAQRQRRIWGSIGDGKIGPSESVGANFSSNWDQKQSEVERMAVFAQMAAAGVIGGLNSKNPIDQVGWGLSMPATSLPGVGVRIGHSHEGQLAIYNGAPYGGVQGYTLNRGHQWELTGSVTSSFQYGGYGLSGSQAVRIDRKLDDGMPNSGAVRAIGRNNSNLHTTNGNFCKEGEAITSKYLEINQDVACSLAIKASA